MGQRASNEPGLPAGVNRVLLVGTAEAAPMVRTGTLRMSFTTLFLKVVVRNQGWGNTEDRPIETRIEVDAFGRNADVLVEKVQAGAQLMIEGMLVHDRNDPRVLKVQLESFQFLPRA